MTNDEIIAFLKVHLQSIQDNDTQTYDETTSEDLTLYEWWITPHRIDGLPFHEFMMTSNAERGTVFGAEGKAKSPTRFDLSNLHIQNYGDTAIASYTLLISTACPITNAPATIARAHLRPLGCPPSTPAAQIAAGTITGSV